MRKIITYPDPRLKETSTPVTAFGAALGRLARELETIIEHTNAMGVSAPQVGDLARVIAVRREKENDVIVIVNPELAETGGCIIDEEGCLSLPDFFIPLPRPQKAVVKGSDINGASLVYEAYGYFARAAVHEIEHLDGKLMWDNLDGKNRELAIAAYLKGLDK